MNTQPLFENDCINLIELCNTNPELANRLINNTVEFPFIYYKSLNQVPYILFKNLSFSSKNINKIIGIRGTIIKTGQVLLKNTKIEYTCLKCNFKGFISDIDNSLKFSVLCESCGSNSVVNKECLNEAAKTQTLRVQNIGSLSNITDLYEIYLERESAGKFQAGSEVIICGILKLKWKPLKVNELINTSLYIHCLHITKSENDDKFKNDDLDEFADFFSKSNFNKRKFLIESFTSDIYGHSNVKLGLLLVLANQYKEESKTDSNTRQLSHVLLLGDTGTAKTQLLKICSKLVTPAIMTNGIGTSNAGLTSCAVKHGKEWGLEAGALLLADLGICCIDEFNKLKVNEKGGLLEAMEQQTLSIAKAGILSTLNTRCSIIAACNTKHQYDKNKNVSENTLISTPLISRFDLIFGLFDTKNRTKDENIADKILDRINFRLEDKAKPSHLWTLCKLKNFLHSIRRKECAIDEANSNILLKYYLKKKTKEGPNEFNTIRMLESLVRLSETHAKILGKKVVEEEDVFSVILLFETTISSTSLISLKYDELFINESVYEESVNYIKKIYLIS